MIKLMNYCDMKEEVFARKKEFTPEIDERVRTILEKVEASGDKALVEYARNFDGVILTEDTLEVSEDEVNEAFSLVEPELLDTIKKAAQNIERFHKNQCRKGFEISSGTDEILGQKIVPLNRVGIYVPGGTASYPSTVLMNAIPAKIAGVKEIIMATPPQSDGKLKASVIVAAKLVGVDRIFKMGGAQAIGALAFGTKHVPCVDKITGPGNVYVATAKRMVFGIVDIDMIAGPSEILVVADECAIAKNVAADMLSQAEHDKNASAVLITDNLSLANEVNIEIEKQLQRLQRQEIARASIEQNGKIIITKSIAEAIEVSNRIAPEHLELCVRSPFEVFELVENAGSVFLGNNTPEALGDYFAGTNHTLPTSGAARFASPLSVDDFIKKSTYIYYSKKALEGVYKNIVCFANEEGLGAHAKSVSIRFEEEE